MAKDGAIANILSANPMPRGVIAYHSVTLIPILAVASIYAVRRLSFVTKKFSKKELSIFVLLTSIAGGYFLAPLPLPGSLNYWAPVNFISLPDPFISVIKNNIGISSSVSAQSNVGAHFSQRKEIYQFPNKTGEVDFIILRLSNPTKKIILNNIDENAAKFQIGMLDAHLQMNRKEYIKSIKELLKSDKYQILFWHDPWLVFKRDLSRKENEHSELVGNKLKKLQDEWSIEQ